MLVVRPVGSCKVFLPKSEDHAGGGFGAAAATEVAGRLLAGWGGQKEEGLVSPEDGVERGM